MKKKYKYTNEILEDHGEWVLVDISTPKHPDATMAVDRDVFEAHEGGRIHAEHTPHRKYIRARYGRYFNRKKKIFLFHRDVIAILDGYQCDHITHGTMSFIDNRHSNLREVTHSQNCMNQSIRSNNGSGITGVYWEKRIEKWRAYIKINGKMKHLGSFDNIDFAIGARQQAEREYFGEYAHKQ